MIFSFMGYGHDIVTFLGLASIDSSIKHLAIDSDGKRLFTSATIEEGKHCWALVSCNFFSVEGKGTCVVNIAEMNKALKLVKSSALYNCIVDEDGELIIENQGDLQDRTTVDLIPTGVHTGPENTSSSYVLPEEVFGGKRYRFPLFAPGESPLPIPVPKTPPNPENENGHFKQTYTIPISELLTKINNGKAIGCDHVRIGTEPDQSEVSFLIEADHISNYSHVKVEGEVCIEWEHVFDLHVISKMLQHADEGQAYVASTDKPDPAGVNPGLWLGFQVPSLKDEKKLTTACYNLSIINS